MENTAPNGLTDETAARFIELRDTVIPELRATLSTLKTGALNAGETQEARSVTVKAAEKKLGDNLVEWREIGGETSSAMNWKWYFNMYSDHQDGQSFHEENIKSRYSTKIGMTMAFAAQTTEPLDDGGCQSAHIDAIDGSPRSLNSYDPFAFRSNTVAIHHRGGKKHIKMNQKLRNILSN